MCLKASRAISNSRCSYQLQLAVPRSESDLCLRWRRSQTLCTPLRKELLNKLTILFDFKGELWSYGQSLVPDKRGLSVFLIMYRYCIVLEVVTSYHYVHILYFSEHVLQVVTSHHYDIVHILLLHIIMYTYCSCLVSTQSCAQTLLRTGHETSQYPAKRPALFRNWYAKKESIMQSGA